MKKKKNVSQFSKTAHNFFKNLFAVPKIKKFNTVFIDPDGVRQIDPPYIICANHVNFWDPFWLNIVPKGQIRYIVSDNAWRNPLRAWFLNKVGAIPKAKSMSDITTIRGILQVVKEKGVIGLFPEGIRSWDGSTANIFFSTSKLIKRLKIPLITAKIQGGFYTRPRWSSKNHIGKVTIELKIALTPDQLSNMTDEEIHAKLTEYLQHDEVAYQEKEQISFKSNHKALHMEYALFTCPHCGTIGDLHGKNNSFSCNNCKNTIRVNDKWLFEPASHKDKVIYNNIRDWYNWQLGDILTRIKSNNKDKTIKPLFEDKGATLLIADAKDRLRIRIKGTASLDKNEIRIYNNRKDIRIALKDIKAINVQDDEKLEFKVEGVTHRLDFDHIVSAMKWKKSVNDFKEVQGIAEPSQVTSL